MLLRPLQCSRLVRSSRVLLHKQNRRYASDKKYSDTLNLPHTTFPLRTDHASNSGVQEASTLYAWQRSRRRATGSALDRHGYEVTSTSNEPRKDEFILHDGPPFANGNLHMGHATNKILKDMIVRRKILEGRKVNYTPGWDCHGLPIELKALQARQAETSSSFEALAPIEIRSIARELAISAISAQSEQFQKMAICADWASPYRTLDLSYELAQMKVFGHMVERGLIYRAEKPVYWSPSSCSALAEAELEYSDAHISKSAYVAYPLSSPFQGIENVSLLIWTTTPWTLPANRAIAVNVDLEYSLLTTATGDRHFLVAASLVEEVILQIPVLIRHPHGPLSGRDLVGETYLDVFHGTHTEPRPVVTADYVSAESGTGLVHTAPGHGQEDYLLCRSLPNPILPFSPVDNAGHYTSAVGIQELIGLHVQTEGSARVLLLLEESGTLLSVRKYKHKYPYDWRTQKPIIVRSTPQFFANLSSIKAIAMAEIDQVSMVPLSGKARLKSYVASRDEWCISRQRSWGVPIPALYDDNGELLMTQESISHIMSVLKREGMESWFAEDQSPDDWQKWVAESYRGGKKWTRGRETLDVWFDSGCSWNTIQSRDAPSTVADLYLEGSDQHRGWFQSSLLTSIATRGVAPYKEVLTHGFVLDDKGRKMSKSIGNVMDPLLIISGREATEPLPIDESVTDKKKRKQLIKIAIEAAAEIKPLGTDVLRLWVAQSDFTSDVSVSHGILSHVSESLRKFRTTIRYMIGNLTDYDPTQVIHNAPFQAIDNYAVSSSSRFLREAERNFAQYHFNKVVAQLNQYTNAHLSAFYFDTLKDRLYADTTHGLSRRSAQKALYCLLKHYLLVLAPICPFLVSEAWRHLPDQLTGGAEHIYASDWHGEMPHESGIMSDGDWTAMMLLRDSVNKHLETARKNKTIKSSLEAAVTISLPGTMRLPVPDSELANFLIVSDVRISRADDLSEPSVLVDHATHAKCPRCWNYTAPASDELCGRCEKATRDVV